MSPLPATRALTEGPAVAEAASLRAVHDVAGQPRDRVTAAALGGAACRDAGKVLHLSGLSGPKSVQVADVPGGAAIRGAGKVPYPNGLREPGSAQAGDVLVSFSGVAGRREPHSPRLRRHPRRRKAPHPSGLPEPGSAAAEVVPVSPSAVAERRHPRHRQGTAPQRVARAERRPRGGLAGEPPSSGGAAARTSFAAPVTPSPPAPHVPPAPHTPALRTTIWATTTDPAHETSQPHGQVMRCAWRDRGHGAGVSTAEPAARKDHTGGDSHLRRAVSGATNARLAQTRAPVRS
ncbi:hypothetical protein JOD27_006461 [Lentzea nigeriaca]|nr:hypothetical protein [Lentzea nigeriaca]